MTKDEKQKIAVVASTLIDLLDECDDEAWIDTVLTCVESNDPIPLSTNIMFI